MHVCTCGGNCCPRGAISTVGKDVCNLLASEDEHDFVDLVLYPYVGMNWRGCVNIYFTEDEPPDDRGNIIVMF